MEPELVCDLCVGPVGEGQVTAETVICTNCIGRIDCGNHLATAQARGDDQVPAGIEEVS